MIITKKAIARRAVLRGTGVALALPLLDAMVPALTALERTQARPAKRLGVVYVPNGVVMDHWTPASEGSEFEFTRTLKSLEPFRKHVLVLSGLFNTSNGHPSASTGFLTGMLAKHSTTDGSAVLAGVSVDQLLARELGQHTQLSSLEMGLESVDSSSTCSLGYSCAYTSTISWRTPTTPLPMENNPRVIFEQLFGDGGSTDPAARRALIGQDRSLLDSVRQKVADLSRGLGPRDQAKLTEYLDAVRDVERRIRKAEEQSAQELPIVEQPVGVPATFEEHAKLMFDLQLLAYQSDLTRVITFMMGHEYSGRTYPQIGVPDAHHPTSHHEGNRDKLEKLAKINAYHMTLFADFVARLDATADGDGSLLDHVVMMYGAGISDGNSHLHENLPVLLVGGGAGGLKGGRHLRYAPKTPLANLHVTMLDKLGMHQDRVGNSTGELEGLAGL